MRDILRAHSDLALENAEGSTDISEEHRGGCVIAQRGMCHSPTCHQGQERRAEIRQAPGAIRNGQLRACVGDGGRGDRAGGECACSRAAPHDERRLPPSP